MTNTSVSHVEMKVSAMDISFDSNSDSGNLTNYSQTVEMNLDKSYLSEIQRLQILFHCHVPDVFKTDECKELMNFLRHYSSQLLGKKGAADISNVADNDGCIEFFRSYLAIAIENCSHMLKNISQRQYISLIKLTMALWNMSDQSDSLCARMVAADVHIYLIRLLGKMEITPKLLETRSILLLSMSIVGILHNINRKLQYTRAQYRKENLVKFLMPIADLEISKDIISLKTAALLLLAFLVNENENSVLNAKDDHIIYILEILNDTLSSDEFFSRYYGYHCLEILHSLRHIASPDSNKRSLIKNGVLSFIGLVVQVKNEDKYPDQIVAALELLWSLSFSKECLLALDADGCELKTRVEMLAQNTNQNIILSARGILWNINSAQKSISFNHLIRNDARTHAPNIGGHVMISYQHSTQEIMIKVKNKLISIGYQVWMDVDHMRGSFVDAMAEGIQHAAVLLLGMCQAFKISPHCRQEVKYAYTLGIPLVPIMLEPGFTPDGWLGLMCATLIHTEFIESDKFELNIMQLQRQLGNLGQPRSDSLSNQDSIDGSCTTPLTHQQCTLKCCEEDSIVQEHSSHTNMQPYISHETDSTDLVISFQSDHSTSLNRMQNFITEISSECQNSLSLDARNCKNLSYENPSCCYCIQTELQVLNWSQSQCNSWFSTNDIPVDNCGYPLSEIDGPLLLELVEMRKIAPEMFFKSAKEDLKLDFLHVLKLSRALKSLEALS